MDELEEDENCIYKSNGSDFFKKLESHLRTSIPSQIKNILSLCDYDSLTVLKEFDDNSFSAIQDYLRSDFSDCLLNEGENLANFLGRYSKCQQKFQFNEGQKEWLQIIVRACENLHSLRPIQEDHDSNISSAITAHDLESLKTMIRKWICSQPALTESLKQDFRFEIIKKSPDKVEILCPCRTCKVHLSATKKAYRSYYKKKKNGPQKRGNPRWHISAIRVHLLQYHKIVDDQDIEIDDTRSQLSQSPSQMEDEPSTEQIEQSDDDFMGFPNTSNFENPQRLSRKRRIRVIQNSPVTPAKRTRSTRSKLTSS